MLQKQSILVDKASGEEWVVTERMKSNLVVDAEGKSMQLYVYVLRNQRQHKRFVYEHLIEREYEEKRDAV